MIMDDQASERLSEAQQHLRVLRRIHRELSDSNVEWAVTAGMSLYLQGLPVEPQDIDLRTDEAGAYEIERRFGRFVIKPVASACGERIRSHFGALLIDGIKVEIIGDPETREAGGTWAACHDWKERKLYVELSGQRIPVLPLELEYEQYVAMGRIEKAALLKDCLGGNAGK